MNPAEAAHLLTLATTFDNRNVSEAQAIAWAEALHDLTFEDSKRALVAHYRESTEWCMPAHIYRRVQVVQGNRIRSAPVFEFAEHPELDVYDDTSTRSHAFFTAADEYRRLVRSGVAYDDARLRAVQHARTTIDRQIEGQQ